MKVMQIRAQSSHTHNIHSQYIAAGWGKVAADATEKCGQTETE